MSHERSRSRRNEYDIHTAEWDLARVSYFDPQGERPRAFRKLKRLIVPRRPKQPAGPVDVTQPRMTDQELGLYKSLLAGAGTPAPGALPDSSGLSPDCSRVPGQVEYGVASCTRGCAVEPSSRTVAANLEASTAEMAEIAYDARNQRVQMLKLEAASSAPLANAAKSAGWLAAAARDMARNANRPMLTSSMIPTRPVSNQTCR